MTTKIRMAIASVMLAAAIGLLCASNAMSGGPEKEIAAAVTKVAEALKKGDMEGAAKLATKAAAMKQFEDTADLMHLFKPRNKGGMGWGPTEGKNAAKDGLEKKIQDYAKAVNATEATDPNNVEAGYWIAALAEITKAKRPDKDAAGGKTKKAWTEMAEQMRDQGIAFSKASAGKKANDIKNAADKVNTVCTNCHSKFK